MDIAAGTAGFISLGIQILQSLTNYYQAYKSQHHKVVSTTQKIKDLLELLKLLEDEIQARRSRPDYKRCLDVVAQCDASCKDTVKELQTVLDKVKVSPTQSALSTIKVAATKLGYPFRESTLIKIEEEVADFRNNLAAALSILQLKDSRSALDHMSVLKDAVDSVRAHQISSSAKQWLDPPDPSLDHNRLAASRFLDTGLWFLDGSQFSDWLQGHIKFLWMHGVAGCGKSLLCSSVIDRTLKEKAMLADAIVVYYYFSFADASKQNLSGMLRSLMFQLSRDSAEGAKALEDLQNRHSLGFPPDHVLVEHLRDSLQAWPYSYIIIDALDEIPDGQGRVKVLKVLKTLRGWKLPQSQLSLLVTSRDLWDIRNSLAVGSREEVGMRNGGIDRDIARYIHGQLLVDPRLQKWHNFRTRIEESLSVRGRRNYLAGLPVSERNLERGLRNLPQTLDETYERTLANINPDLAEDARNLLIILCFSRRVLTVEEIVHALAVDVSYPPSFDPKRLLGGADDIRLLCPGLVVIERSRSMSLGEDTVRIAHFSVQEYLTSPRIKSSSVASFSVDTGEAHWMFTTICIVILGVLDECEEMYSLEKYAGNQWHEHRRLAPAQCADLDTQLISLAQMPFKHTKNIFYFLEPTISIETIPSHVEKVISILTNTTKRELGTFHEVLSELSAFYYLLQLAVSAKAQVAIQSLLRCRWRMHRWPAQAKNSSWIPDPVETFAGPVLAAVIRYTDEPQRSIAVKLLLENNASPNEVVTVLSEGRRLTSEWVGCGLLHLAIDMKALDVLELLIEFLADLEAERWEHLPTAEHSFPLGPVSSSRHTAIEWAEQQGFDAAVKLLQAAKDKRGAVAHNDPAVSV